jgi:hypothetical protein
LAYGLRDRLEDFYPFNRDGAEDRGVKAVGDSSPDGAVVSPVGAMIPTGYPGDQDAGQDDAMGSVSSDYDGGLGPEEQPTDASLLGTEELSDEMDLSDLLAEDDQPASASPATKGRRIRKRTVHRRVYRVRRHSFHRRTLFRKRRRR